MPYFRCSLRTALVRTLTVGECDSALAAGGVLPSAGADVVDTATRARSSSLGSARRDVTSASTVSEAGNAVAIGSTARPADRDRGRSCGGCGDAVSLLSGNRPRVVGVSAAIDDDARMIE
jgi:hypothetical protein